jgi:hypothetical protein
MRYEPIAPTSLAAAEGIIHDPEALAQAVIAIGLHHKDPIEAQTLCVRFAQHADPGVRGNSLLALGHLARLHRKLDRGICEPGPVGSIELRARARFLSNR